MPQVKYKIYRLSARAIIGYGKEQADGYHSFELNKQETGKCILSGVQEQDDNALFYQIMDELHGGVSSGDMIIDDLFFCFGWFEILAAQNRQVFNSQVVKNRKNGLTKRGKCYIMLSGK